MKYSIPAQFKRKFLLLFCISQLLVGCQTFNAKPINTPLERSAQQHQQALARLQQWQVQGKLIFKSNKKKFSASLNWSQHNRRADIRLTTFLGISILKMITDEQQSTLTADGNTYTSTSPEALLRETSEITLPINHLPQWMKGAIGQGSNQTMVLDGHNRIANITLLDDDGQPWRIDYHSYTLVDGHHLPKKLRLSGNDITVTIKIFDWTLLDK